MLTSVLVDYEDKSLETLAGKITANCPQIKISGCAKSWQKALDLIKKLSPDLIFVEVNLPKIDKDQLLQEVGKFNLETIIVTDLKEFAVDAFKYNVSGYLLKPVNKHNLISAVYKAQKAISKKTSNNEHGELLKKVLNFSLANELIGIPSLKGLEFFTVKEIIRCEGLQRCTRIVTKSKSNIVSSYNLGEFRKIFVEYRFFSPHKSHLINLNCIRQYNREGTITMIDGSVVPISRRKKQEFLQCMPYLKNTKAIKSNSE